MGDTQDGGPVYDCVVLVVGAGLVGLAASMFLAHQGLQVWLVERHASISEHPKARGVHIRTMELYRAAGIEPAVRAAADRNLGIAVGDTLAGEYELVRATMDPAEAADLSPTTMSACDQHRIEPVLRARSTELGARLFYGCTAVRIQQDDFAVTVDLAPTAGEAGSPLPGRIRSRYLVAADGANSPIRDKLGIGRHGEPVPGTGLSVLFEADLEPALRGRRVGALASPAARAILVTHGNERNRKWFGAHPRTQLDDVGREDLDGEVASLIRSVVGQPDLDVKIQSALTWTTGGYIADHYRDRRIFLVGDAAHLMPPYGGLGGTTGVADAHNLAWKLAAVCRGDAGDALLDTYESERQTLAEFTVKQVLGLGPNGLESFLRQRTEFSPRTISLGFRYSVAGASSFDPDLPIEDPAKPSGEPGTRAPHVPLRGAVSSTLDLLEPHSFTFLTSDTGIYSSALSARPVPGVALRAVGRNELADPAKWDRIFPTASSSGLLVRPDGVICWRATPDPDDAWLAVHRARADALHPVMRTARS
jgi:putative polyketide hydroxylase